MMNQFQRINLMTNKFLFPFLCVILFGCASNTTGNNDNHINTETHVEEVSTADDTNDYTVSCKHKYDNKRQFTYSPKDATKYIVDKKLSIYKIKDVNDKYWTINNFELENYKCFKKS